MCVTGQLGSGRWSRSRSPSTGGWSGSPGTCRSVRGSLAAWLGRPESGALLIDLQRKQRDGVRWGGKRGGIALGAGGGQSLCPEHWLAGPLVELDGDAEARMALSGSVICHLEVLGPGGGGQLLSVLCRCSQEASGAVQAAGS